MRFLCRFRCHPYYMKFCVEELEALSEMFGVLKAVLWDSNESREEVYRTNFCFVYINLPNKLVAQKIFDRSVLINSIILVWSEGSSLEEVREDMLKNHMEDFRSNINESCHWTFNVVSYGKHKSQKEKVEIMNYFKLLFKGDEKVDLKNPDCVIAIALNWESANVTTKKTEKKAAGDESKSANQVKEERKLENQEKELNIKFEEKKLRKVYFGIEVAHRVGGQPRHWMRYNLSNRYILGPTTLDNELSFIMCNQGRVRKGTVILDPFVGTGGILIAASHFGAICIGSDIDPRVLKGWGVSYRNPKITLNNKSESTNIYTNFYHYGLPIPDIIRCDNSSKIWRGSNNDSNEGPDKCVKLKNKNSKYAYNNSPWVDAIITDPPYGIRASSRKCGSRKQFSGSNMNKNTHSDSSSFTAIHADGIVMSNSNEDVINSNDEANNIRDLTSFHNHFNDSNLFIPPTTTYDIKPLIDDLLTLASRLLNDEGLLVFLCPVVVKTMDEQISSIKHKDLKILSSSLQRTSAGMGRVLITMRRLPRNVVQ